MRYVTLTQLRSALSVTTVELDNELTLAAGAAEEMVDAWCHRTFAVAPQQATARSFTAADPLLTVIDDAVEIVSVATDEDGDGIPETAWAASDFRAWPTGAPTAGRPYTRLRVAPQGSHLFPLCADGVQVTARWGWAATPEPVVQATVILAARWLKRAREAPFGVAPIAAFDGSGIELRARVDPDVQVLLEPYARRDL